MTPEAKTCRCKRGAYPRDDDNIKSKECSTFDATYCHCVKKSSKWTLREKKWVGERAHISCRFTKTTSTFCNETRSQQAGGKFSQNTQQNGVGCPETAFSKLLVLLQIALSFDNHQWHRERAGQSEGSSPTPRLGKVVPAIYYLC